MSVGDMTATDWAMQFAKPGDLVVIQTGATVDISVLVVAGEAVESVSIARSGEGPVVNQAIDLVREREVRAARRCNADPDVWRAAHAIHTDRKFCLVTLDSGEARGFITGLGDEGISLGSGYSYEWPRIRSIVAVGN
jgi:hypothetical protein